MALVCNQCGHCCESQGGPAYTLEDLKLLDIEVQIRHLAYLESVTDDPEKQYEPCYHYDQVKQLCTIYDQRPPLCREYFCEFCSDDTEDLVPQKETQNGNPDPDLL